MGGFRTMLLDYFRVVEDVNPRVVCEVGHNYGASISAIMLAASPRTRAVVFGDARGYRGYAMDVVATLFRSNSSSWLPSICGAKGVHSSPDSENSRVFFVPGDSHKTLDGFARSVWSRGADCRAEVARWLPPGSNFLRNDLQKESGKDTQDASALKCDLVNIDGDRTKEGAYQDITDMRRHSRANWTHVLVDVTEPTVRHAVDDAIHNNILHQLEEHSTPFKVDNAGPNWQPDKYELSMNHRNKIWRRLIYV